MWRRSKLRLALDLLAPPALLFFGWSGARYWPRPEGGMDAVAAFLFSALFGVLAGFRVAWAAFRWGRRRRGKDPDRRPAAPDEVVLPLLRFIGCSLGSVFCAFTGFVVWALAVAFFRAAGSP